MEITKIKAGIVALFFVAIAMTGCQKMQQGTHKHGPHEEDATQYITIDKTLAYGEVYTLDLNPYEDADDLSTITTQATKFTISALTGLASTTNNVYTYSLNKADRVVVPTPTPSDTASTQQVVLTVTEGAHANSGGGCNGGSGNSSHVGNVEAVITINFTIK